MEPGLKTASRTSRQDLLDGQQLERSGGKRRRRQESPASSSGTKHQTGRSEGLLTCVDQ